ncbi:MAG: hypothetical protein ACFFE4_22000 [Candidatus Thorarchaeota archaeon]
MSEIYITRIINERRRRIPVTSDIHNMVSENRMMLLKLLMIMGMTRDEITEFLRNPGKEIKEMMFELDYGPTHEKKYCPKCEGLLYPTKITKNFLHYYCSGCRQDFREKY